MSDEALQNLAFTAATTAAPRRRSPAIRVTRVSYEC
jgi:hypothetical protein